MGTVSQEGGRNRDQLGRASTGGFGESRRGATRSRWRRKQVGRNARDGELSTNFELQWCGKWNSVGCRFRCQQAIEGGLGRSVRQVECR